MPVRRHHHQQYCHHRDKHHDDHCHRHQHHHQQRHRHHRRLPAAAPSSKRFALDYVLGGQRIGVIVDIGMCQILHGPIDAALSELGTVMRYQIGRSVSGQRLRTVSQNSWKWSGTATCTASCVTRYQRTDIGEDEENPKNESPDDENFKP